MSSAKSAASPTHLPGMEASSGRGIRRRVAVDWNRPLVSAAAKFLLSGDRDLGRRAAIVALPSGRAIGRLRECLVRAAETSVASDSETGGSGTGKNPPRHRLVGLASLTRLLTPPPLGLELASEFEQTLAWGKVLLDADPELRKLLVPNPPAESALASWLELGGTLRRLHQSLAAEAMTLEDARAHAASPTEQRRWQWLCELRDAYLASLHQAGRWDLNEAALDALATGTLTCDRPIVLVGATDLSPLLRGLLQRLESPIIALVACPRGDLAGFDELGTLIPSSWRDHEIEIDENQMISAGPMADQSRAVIESLAEFGQSFAVDEITIGVTDESHVQPIENECRLGGVTTVRHLGYRLSETSIGRLLDRLVDLTQRRDWSSLAALVRHADVHRFVTDQLTRRDAATATEAMSDNWLASLDRLIHDTLPRSIDGPLGQHADAATVQAIADVILQWIAPLSQSRRPIGMWSETVKLMVSALYPDLAANQNSGSPPPVSGEPARGEDSTDDGTELEPSLTDRALAAMLQVLDQFAELSEMLDLPIEGPLALELLVARLSDVSLSDHATPDKIEILGWLDLTLDEAPALVVCGVNQPFVPEAIPGDPYLPTTLRRSLVQANNDRRYGRDVHALSHIMASREQIRFIVGTHSADGSPTPPSRLLSATSADEAARRLTHLLTRKRPLMRVVAPQPERKSPAPRVWSHPPLVPLRPVTTMSVTAFSDYLACPYRFYLRHVLKLKPLDDAATELAANQFGDLVHGALEWFGRSREKDATEEDQICKAMFFQLHRFAKERYGENVSPTVRLQVRQAERRLATVAQRQAERIATGWFIDRVEASVDERDRDRDTGKPKRPTGIVVDGKFMGLRGRFDRIDHHPATGRWAILDYKTHGHPPEKKHLRRTADGSTRWVDLQLPLYRRFIPDLNIDAAPEQVELGYFNIAEKDTETKINLANFTPQQYAAADELMTWCVEQVFAGRFEPANEPPTFDDYAFLMNERVGGVASPDQDDEEEGWT